MSIVSLMCTTKDDCQNFQRLNWYWRLGHSSRQTAPPYDLLLNTNSRRERIFLRHQPLLRGKGLADVIQKKVFGFYEVAFGIFQSSSSTGTPGIPSTNQGYSCSP